MSYSFHKMNDPGGPTIVGSAAETRSSRPVSTWCLVIGILAICIGFHSPAAQAANNRYCITTPKQIVCSNATATKPVTMKKHALTKKAKPAKTSQMKKIVTVCFDPRKLPKKHVKKHSQKRGSYCLPATIAGSGAIYVKGLGYIKPGTPVVLKGKPGSHIALSGTIALSGAINIPGGTPVKVGQTVGVNGYVHSPLSTAPAHAAGLGEGISFGNASSFGTGNANGTGSGFGNSLNESAGSSGQAGTGGGSGIGGGTSFGGGFGISTSND